MVAREEARVKVAVFREILKNKYLYLLALPGLLFLLVFAYLPMTGYLIAFKKYRLSDGLWGSEWVGFDNFKFFFMGSDWYKVTFNTIFLNGLFIVCGLGIALLLAIFLNEVRNLVFKKIAQTFIFMPYFISWLVVSMMVFAFLNTTDGILNRTLAAYGIQGGELVPNAGDLARCTHDHLYMEVCRILLDHLFGCHNRDFGRVLRKCADRWSQQVPANHSYYDSIDPQCAGRSCLAGGRPHFLRRFRDDLRDYRR